MDPELASRADQLTAAVEGLTQVITVVEKRDARRRTQMVLLAVSVVLDLGLSGGFFYSLTRTNEAQVRADAAQARAGEAQDRTDVLFIEVRRATAAAIAICEDRNEQALRLTKALGEVFIQQDCESLGTQP